MPEAPNDVVRAHGNVRGTQSFVHVMASVFKRPGLIELELTWRCIAALPIVIPMLLGALGMDIHFRSSIGHALDKFATWPTLLEHHAFIFGIDPAGIVLPALIASTYWATMAWLGRTFVLRRLDPTLSPRWATAFILTLLRVWAFVLFMCIWVSTFFRIYDRFITVPSTRGEYPSYVPGFALFTVFTLILFMLWSVTSWIFPLATTLAMSQRLTIAESLRAAWRHRVLRSKVIEINLVMGIVKVALLVLAMVFSACPLPFSNVATQQFLNWWWFGCFLFWVVASDYFHVVRAAAVLRLTQAYSEA